MKKLNIVFMGTPEFAVESLKTLHEGIHEIVGVVTVPDKPAGRGKKLRSSAVKVYAVENGLPLAQPLKLRSEEFHQQLREWNADLFVVVAFRMLPAVVWEMPPMGTINLHGSLLPNYRGAAPINRAIMNGESETGVTTFFITHEIDTGSVIEQTKMPIGPQENAGDVHDRMMVIGANTLSHTVDLIASNQTNPIPQSELIDQGAPLKDAHKLFRPDCEIDWAKDAQEIHNHIRGLSPYPAAWTKMNGKVLKVYSAKPSSESVSEAQVKTDGKGSLHIGCKDGSLEVLDLQLEGKKRMKIEDFLRGLQLQSLEFSLVD